MPERVKTRDAISSTGVIVAAIVLVCMFVAAIAVAAELGRGLNSSTTPVVTTVLTTLGAAVVGLLALVKAEKVDRKTDAVNEKVNGHLSKLADLATQQGNGAEAKQILDDTIGGDKT